MPHVIVVEKMVLEMELFIWTPKTCCYLNTEKANLNTTQ